jgi:hypothetical protein
MADSSLSCVATLDRIGDLVDDTAGVDLRDLPPFTTLLVWTMNSRYRVVVTEWPEVRIQGGAFFPDPTLAVIDGASTGGEPVSESVGLVPASWWRFVLGAGTSPPPRCSRSPLNRR